MKTELLKSAPHAFQALHAVLGFDFCKSCGIAHLSGPYTVGKVQKTAAAGGYKAGDVLAVLTRDEARWQYGSWEYFLATVDAAGDVDIDYRPYAFDLDWFSSKLDFHAVRKAEKADTYIIWQAREFINKPVKKKPDLSARFVFVKAGYCWHNERRYVDRLTLKRTDASGEKYEHECPGYRVYTGTREATDPAECIDKSGYLLQERRANLYYRAARLKQQREKAAADAEDNAGRVQELAALLAARRAELVQALAAADTADALEKVGRALVGFGFSGLADAAHRLERFKDRAARKAFASIAARDEEYDRILQALAKEG